MIFFQPPHARSEAGVDAAPAERQRTNDARRRRTPRRPVNPRIRFFRPNGMVADNIALRGDRYARSFGNRERRGAGLLVMDESPKLRG